MFINNPIVHVTFHVPLTFQLVQTITVISLGSINICWLLPPSIGHSLAKTLTIFDAINITICILYAIYLPVFFDPLEVVE